MLNHHWTRKQIIAFGRRWGTSNWLLVELERQNAEHVIRSLPIRPYVKDNANSSTRRTLNKNN